MNARRFSTRLMTVALTVAGLQWLSAQGPVQLAVAKDDLDTPAERGGYLRALRLGYFPERSGDVLMILKPFNVLDDQTAGTSHGQPYAYDSEVPVLFAGHGVKPGIYPQPIRTVDVAPSVAALLEVGSLANAEGSIRAEALLPGR